MNWGRQPDPGPPHSAQRLRWLLHELRPLALILVVFGLAWGVAALAAWVQP